MLFLPSTICWDGLFSKPFSWTSPPDLPNRDMIGCAGQELSPFSLEVIRSDIEILSLIGSMYDSERIGCYDWKLLHALIVGQEVITPTFWCWNMDIDMLNCSRMRGKGRSAVYFSAFTYLALGQTSCNIVLARSLVTCICPCWHQGPWVTPVIGAILGLRLTSPHHNP